MAMRIQVTFDARDPRELGTFWAQLLGYVEEPPPEGFANWQEALTSFGVAADEMDRAYAIVDPDGAGPRIYLQKVPEGKTAKNRVHLDVDASGGRSAPKEGRQQRIDAAVARAVGLGATVTGTLAEYGGYTVVLADPDGNEFCLH
jgi:Glyoxalase-like domain